MYMEYKYEATHVVIFGVNSDEILSYVDPKPYSNSDVDCESPKEFIKRV